MAADVGVVAEAGAAGILSAVAHRFAVDQVGGSPALAAARPLPAASAALGALAEQAGARGPVTPDPGPLSERERYQVSILIERACERAERQQVPAAVLVALRGVGKAWDAAAGVAERSPAVRAYIAAGRPAGVQPRDLGA